jgi:hypothetical protein
MIKTTVYISAAIAFSCSTIHASDRAFAGYVVGCQHNQAPTSSSLVPKALTSVDEPKHYELGNLEKYICFNSSDPRCVKYCLPLELFKKYYHLFLSRPNLSVTIDDNPEGKSDASSEFPASSLPSANSSSTTQPDKP